MIKNTEENNPSKDRKDRITYLENLCDYWKCKDKDTYFFFKKHLDHCQSYVQKEKERKWQ